MAAEAVAKALGGHKTGAFWMARCPAHEDREPSLSIADGDDGKVLVRCHAGCEQHRVIAALRVRGLWGGPGRSGASAPPSPSGKTVNLLRKSEGSRTEAALGLWGGTAAASGTSG